MGYFDMDSAQSIVSPQAIASRSEMAVEGEEELQDGLDMRLDMGRLGRRTGVVHDGRSPGMGVCPLTADGVD
jgi:hypothetical protein